MRTLSRVLPDLFADLILFGKLLPSAPCLHIGKGTELFDKVRKTERVECVSIEAHCRFQNKITKHASDISERAQYL